MDPKNTFNVPPNDSDAFLQDNALPGVLFSMDNDGDSSVVGDGAGSHIALAELESDSNTDIVSSDRPAYEERHITTPSMTIACSAPPDLAGSPLKKVQFEVGGEDDDEVSDKMDQQRFSMGSNDNSNTPTKNRTDPRDYISAAVSFLPPISEEKNAPVYSGIYGRSISVDPSGKSPSHQVSYTMPELLTKPQEAFGFVQLDVLTGEGDVGQREWKETTRWIKYEEDVEEGADRWGKAHVASLSFHSLIKLRQLIERDGIIMLNLEEKDMPGVAYRVVEELSAKGLIRPDESPLLMRALLLKHKHVQETERSWFGLKRTNTSAVSLQSLFDDKGKVRDTNTLVRRNNSLQKHVNDITNSSRALQRTASGNYLKYTGDLISAETKLIGDQFCPSEEDLKWIQRKENMRRLLPSGAEATLVMVGDFDTLKKPIFVFVRLAEAAFMFNVTEVPVPVRFFSILLVPNAMDMDLMEIGRSIGTLMSNQDFHAVACTASGRKNLMTGINDFLDDSIVLPPAGDWDSHDLLPLHVLQSKSKAIKLRRLKKQQSSSFLVSNESFHDGAGLTMNNVGTVPDEIKDKYGSPFIRTGRPFGGLINDVKRRYRHYRSDFVDAVNFQCFATVAFMFFASIAQVITFAGLMGEKTNNLIGMSETLIATSAAGTVFSLTSAQPLIPIGPTGPLLVFDEILFLFCERHQVEFLPTRLWISIWLFVICFLVVCFEGSVVVKWFTKFTQDIFAVLTSVLLIFESVDNLIEVYVHHPLTSSIDQAAKAAMNFTIDLDLNDLDGPIIDETEDLRSQPNTALLCTILMLGTFFIAYFLREFRNSVFLGEKARRALGDFGVPIAILTMVFLDYCAVDTYTRKMKVPPGLQPSSEERDWIVSPMGQSSNFNLYIAVGCALPAMLIFILMFMTTQICELIVNTKERKLVKGSGFHLDLLLVALINLGCGFMGAPWLCCATLRGLAHVTALTVYSQNNPPGEKASIVHVKEQRVTSLSVSLLIGFSVLMGPFLQFIPLAVLFGVFLYMGVSSLSTTQLFERISLLFIPVKSHPQVPYVRRVKTWKMHLYTIIQIGCLAVLWTVKSTKEAALAFPFVLMILVPIRLQLKYFYTPNELEALDGKVK